MNTLGEFYKNILNIEANDIVKLKEVLPSLSKSKFNGKVKIVKGNLVFVEQNNIEIETEVYGLYQENGTVVTWATLTNTYGMDISKKYTVTTYKTNIASQNNVFTTNNLTSSLSLSKDCSITKIGERLFYYCMGSINIIIPDSVTVIHPQAFISCTNLTNITFKITSNWFVTTSLDEITGTKIDVTNSEVNSTNLKNTYIVKYWKRS